MPTAIEQSYLDQGYVLPEPLTWDDVAQMRTRSEVEPILVPLGFAPGCLAWGVPIVEGKHLKHP